MGANETELLNRIIEKTDSILIIFFVLIIIASVLIVIPLYKIISKGKIEMEKNQNNMFDKYMERENQVLEIIERSTEIISSLKTLFETALNDFSISNEKINAHLEDVNNRINVVSEKLNNIILKLNLYKKRSDKNE